MIDVVVKDHANYDWKEHLPPTEQPPSLTVPDMAESLAKFIERYTKGLAVPLYQPEYDGGEEVVESDFAHLSQFEKIDLARQNERRVRILHDELNLQKATAEEKRRTEQYEKDVLEKAKTLIKPNEQA